MNKPTLPANTLGNTQQNKADIGAFARYFVTAELANTMRPAAMDTTLDIVLGLRALKGYYNDYLNQLGEATVDLSNIPSYLSKLTLDSLNTNQRKYLESRVAAEVGSINAGILRAIDFLAGQLIAITPDSQVMEDLMAARAKQYPSYDVAPPSRKARRTAPAA